MECGVIGETVKGDVAMETEDWVDELSRGAAERKVASNSLFGGCYSKAETDTKSLRMTPTSRPTPVATLTLRLTLTPTLTLAPTLTLKPRLTLKLNLTVALAVTNLAKTNTETHPEAKVMAIPSADTNENTDK